VPPVTAERSPPDSRMTGADSPVMADSFTDATPSITSPSLGIKSPASTSTMSPGFSWVAATIRCVFPPFCSSLAWASVLVLRKDAACALPRPSATASAKLANSTVNQSQRLIWNEKARLPAPVTRSRRNRIVVSADTISTVNITGLRTMIRGLSFLKASPIAGHRIFGSVIVAMGIRLRIFSTPRGLAVLVVSMVQTFRRAFRRSSRNVRQPDRVRGQGNR